MAREIVTLHDLETFSDLVAKSLARIEDVKRQIRESEPQIRGILIHSSVVKNVAIPRLFDWAMEIQVEAEKQIASHRLGVRSTAEISKQQNERRKEREAAPAPAKPARKKPAK